jgi:hypothetical protein
MNTPNGNTANPALAHILARAEELAATKPFGKASQSSRKIENVCPECGHQFRGNGFDGIDAHWRAEHESIMPYKDAWPLIRSGRYKHPGWKDPAPVHSTEEQRKEYDRLVAVLKKQGVFR